MYRGTQNMDVQMNQQMKQNTPTSSKNSILTGDFNSLSRLGGESPSFVKQWTVFSNTITRWALFVFMSLFFAANGAGANCPQCNATLIAYPWYPPQAHIQAAAPANGQICFGSTFTTTATLVPFASGAPVPNAWHYYCPNNPGSCSWVATTYGSYSYSNIAWTWTLTRPDYTTTSGSGATVTFLVDQFGGSFGYSISFTAVATIPLWITVSPDYQRQYTFSGTLYLTTACENCSTCASSGGCTQVQLSSVDVKMSMGPMRFKKNSIGRLRIHEEKPSPELATPFTLKYEGFEGEEHGVEVIRDGEMLRQIRSPHVLADVIVVNGQKYEVRFYDDPGVKKDGLYRPEATHLMSTTVIENPDSGVFNRLKVTRRNGEKTREAVYAWNEGTSEWALENGGGLKRESLKREFQDRAKVETRQITDGMGNLVKKAIHREEFVPGKYRKVEDIEDPDGAQLRKTVLYDAEGKLIQEINPDGSWQYYQYNEKKLKWRVYSSYLNQDPTNDSLLCRMTEYSYQPVDGKDDGSVRSAHPRCTIEYLKGQEIGRTYYVISPGEEQKIQCQTPGAAWNAPDNLVTVTRKYVDGPFADELKRLFNADGTVELHEFEISANGRQRTETVYRGQPNADRTGVIKGTKTVTVTGIGGDTVMRQVTDIASGLVIEREVHSTVGDDKRTHRVDYLDGTFETQTYGCCGQVEREVDRQGIETAYAYDDLDRRILTSRNGLTFIENLDAEGRVLERIRQGTDGSQVILARNTFDLAGRLLTKTDAQEAKTTHSYAVDNLGQRIVTTTYPDGGQRSESYARDGRLLKLAGSATHPVRYGYDLEIDNGISRETTWEIKLDADGNDTQEWTKTHRDMLGRGYKRIHADGAFEQSFFNQKNQLWKRQDADGVINLQQYNGCD